jgi:hypothetical protein
VATVLFCHSVQKGQGIFALMLLETEGKFQHKMLTLPTGLLSIGQWQNTWSGVGDQFYCKNNSGAYFLL